MNRLTLTPMSKEEYDRLPGERCTYLKEILKSPKAYRWAVEHGTERKPEFDVGSATGVAVFEPGRFASAFRVFPGKSRRGEAYEFWRRANAGSQSLTSAEYELATAMALAVRGDPTASKYLKSGMPEVVARWIDKRTGLQLKASMDWVTEYKGHPCIVELKTAKDAGIFDWGDLDEEIEADTARPHGFATQAAGLRYHMQLAMYRAGFVACMGEEPIMRVIAVEKTQPHDVCVYPVPDDVLACGQKSLDRALDILVECQRTNVWPGKSRGRELNLRLPIWAVDTGEFDVMHFPGIGDE